MDKLKKSIRAFITCAMLFIMLTAIASVLIQTGVIANEASEICMYIVLSLCCFFAGIMSAGIFQWKGILSGMCASAIFIIFIWYGISLYTGDFNPEGLFKPIDIIPVAAGIIGGIIGTNSKK